MILVMYAVHICSHHLLDLLHFFLFVSIIYTLVMSLYHFSPTILIWCNLLTIFNYLYITKMGDNRIIYEILQTTRFAFPCMTYSQQYPVAICLTFVGLNSTDLQPPNPYHEWKITMWSYLVTWANKKILKIYIYINEHAVVSKFFLKPVTSC